ILEGHFPAQTKKVVASYPGLIATLILKGRKRSIELFGKEPAEIVIPYNKEQLDALLMFDEDWQIAIGNYFGQILHHLPSHVLLNFISRHPVIFPVRCKQSPIPNAQIVFTDGSANGKASIVTKNHQKVLETQETSAQRAEITAVIEAFAMFADEEFNLYSDSQYIVRLFPHIETAVLPENKTTIFHLLSNLQQQIWKRNKIFFIGHIRAHSGLPGP
ncbi:RNase H family protein, partial [Enterococcus faecalis]